jgi:hypothetical protein
MFLAIMSIALVALTTSSAVPLGAPVPLGGGPSRTTALGGGGPDLYGYRYLDSDTTCPGAPTYNWTSIKGIGTEITTLTDDTCVGPFPIGFEFPYYWYRVDSINVSSNGYVSFSDRTKYMQPFNPVPSPLGPNDMLAPLLSDLQPEDTASPNGSVWYWSNGADSFIVEWDSIEFWDTGGNNTFQVILTRADSSITFQYKEQSGVPYEGWSPEHNQTGIDNVSGTIGLNYLSGTNPSYNDIHADLAVRFFPPESSLLHDVGVRNAMNDRNGGLFAVRGRPLSFWAVVRNSGNQPEPEYKTYFRVQRTNGSVLFADSMWASASNPGETESLALANTWSPATNGTYLIKVYTKLSGDMLPVNDTATLELHVVTLPGMLTYDGGTPNSTWYFYRAGNGWGNRFVPPVYPCSVQSARVYMGIQATASNPYVGIYDDNGPNGGPGDTLHITTVNVSAANWYTVTPPSPVVIDDGAFFVGATSVVDSEPTFGMDSIPPLSYQKWECLSGAWTPDPSAGIRDFCANARVSGPVGVSEWLQPTPARAPVRIDVSPNPLGSKTTIRLFNPTGLETAVELYDATGSVVRTLELNRGQAALDGRHLADGIYFARVAGTGAPVAKVIVTH